MKSGGGISKVKGHYYILKVAVTRTERRLPLVAPLDPNAIVGVLYI
jgi:hypothetical protein